MNKKRVVIFVDGENLRQSMKRGFKEKFQSVSYLPKFEWTRFFLHLCERAISELYGHSVTPTQFLTSGSPVDHIRTYWYVVNTLTWDTKFQTKEFVESTLVERAKYFRKFASSIVGRDDHVADKGLALLKMNHNNAVNIGAVREF